MLGSAAIGIASNIPANWYGKAHSDGWLMLSNQPTNLGDVFNDLTSLEMVLSSKLWRRLCKVNQG